MITKIRMLSITSTIETALRMDVSNRTISTEAIQAEWQEIQAAKQNPALFRPLYQRYFDPIFRFVRSRCGAESVAGDICSQVFLKAMQKIKGYEFKGVPFSAWLYRIASNEIAQHYRNTKKMRVVSAEETQIEDIVEEMDFDNYGAYREVMLEVLEELKPVDLQLIEMRFFEKRPFKEISAILGLSESNAKVKTYRILERLKKKILKRKG
ncbi:MAG: RNA polymerase sigma-70 factor (ECF subfamily) [Cognaticolwellia sp.]|jgi:RNA polymerase sigma-70 factor (ECF subfamily)